MSIKGKRVVILIEADYQDLEVHYPRLRLLEAGMEVILAGTGSAKRYVGKYGYPVDVDCNVQDIDAGSIDGVVIPGGWAPERLRMSEAVLKLVQNMASAGKVVASICHGGWVLASAGVARGKRITSYIAIKDDLKNAGAAWVDVEVCIDGNLITARKPDDLPAFVRAVIDVLEK
ncbi:MAG: type 1 glutamine amidotransferase [Calditrichaeota bacterium]|nr:type 1 glutamine amidotransferase [Calditrichota bacterium]